MESVKDGDIKGALETLVGKLDDATIENIKDAVKDFLDKVPAEHKEAIKDILSKLENADPEAIKGALAELKDKLDQVAAANKEKLENAVKEEVEKAKGDIVDEAVEKAKEADAKLKAEFDAEFERLDNRIDEAKDRVDEVGAMAAAMATLHSMGYDPEAPSEIAIGVGQYRDTTGFAIGAFHYPNRDFMLNLSVSTAGDEFMGNVGATWKFGGKKLEGRTFDEKVASAEAIKAKQAK